VASYLVDPRPHGRELIQATRARPAGVRRRPARPLVAGDGLTRYKQLQALYRWLEDEEEIAVNPMARMKPPVLPDKPILVVPEDALRRLLAGRPGRGS
jgi:hypothetical protein